MWVVGDSIVRRAADHLVSCHLPLNLGVPQVEIEWKGQGGMHVSTLGRMLESHLGKYPPPDVVVIACGTNDLTSAKGIVIEHILIDSIEQFKADMPTRRVMYSNILPRRKYKHATDPIKVDLKRKNINKHLNAFVKAPNGIKHPNFHTNRHPLFVVFLTGFILQAGAMMCLLTTLSKLN